MDQHLAISLFHILLVVPFFLYVGFQRDQVPEAIYWTLGGLAMGMAAYHFYRAYTRIMDGGSAWINWIHLFLVVPLLAYIAIEKQETPRRFFEMLLLLTFAAAGYHATYLVKHFL